MIKGISAIGTVVLLLSAGCATNDSAPTHRWAATSAAVDEVQYHNDQARCQTEAGLDNERGLDANSAEFSRYKQCMNQRGYVLTAYNQ